MPQSPASRPMYGSNKRSFLSTGVQRSPFVISTGAQRSGEIWPAIGLPFPFETRFLRYVMLRLTPVGMTKRTFAFSCEESQCSSGVIRRIARQSQALRGTFSTAPRWGSLHSEKLRRIQAVIGIEFMNEVRLVVVAAVQGNREQIAIRTQGQKS